MYCIVFNSIYNDAGVAVEIDDTFFTTALYFQVILETSLSDLPIRSLTLLHQWKVDWRSTTRESGALSAPLDLQTPVPELPATVSVLGKTSAGFPRSVVIHNSWV